MKVKSHIAKRGKKTVKVKEHSRKQGKHRSIKSSFLDRVGIDENGEHYVTIMGRRYPYPLIPKEKVGGIISGGGTYYNKHIRGKYF